MLLVLTLMLFYKWVAFLLHMLEEFGAERFWHYYFPLCVYEVR